MADLSLKSCLLGSENFDISSIEINNEQVKGRQEERLLEAEEKMKRKLSFWTRKFMHYQHKTSIIMSLWDFNYMQKRIGLAQIIQEIKNICPGIKINGLAPLENSLFYYLKFEQENDKIECVRSVKKIGDYNVKYMKRNDILNNVDMKIFWLPPDIELKKIHDKLEKYLEIKEIKHTIIRNENLNEEIITSPIIVKAVIKHEYNLNDIPLKMDFGDKSSEPMWGLLTIKGKPQFCLKCNIEGHIRLFCPSKWCNKCKRLYTGEMHSCISSYANIVKSKEEDIIDGEELNDNFQEDIEINYLETRKSKNASNCGDWAEEGICNLSKQKEGVNESEKEKHVIEKKNRNTRYISPLSLMEMTPEFEMESDDEQMLSHQQGKNNREVSMFCDSFSEQDSDSMHESESDSGNKVTQEEITEMRKKISISEQELSMEDTIESKEILTEDNNQGRKLSDNPVERITQKNKRKMSKKERQIKRLAGKRKKQENGNHGNENKQKVMIKELAQQIELKSTRKVKEQEVETEIK